MATSADGVNFNRINGSVIRIMAFWSACAAKAARGSSRIEDKKAEKDSPFNVRVSPSS